MISGFVEGDAADWERALLVLLRGEQEEEDVVVSKGEEVDAEIEDNGEGEEGEDEGECEMGVEEGEWVIVTEGEGDRWTDNWENMLDNEKGRRKGSLTCFPAAAIGLVVEKEGEPEEGEDEQEEGEEPEMGIGRAVEECLVAEEEEGEGEGVRLRSDGGWEEEEREGEGVRLRRDRGGKEGGGEGRGEEEAEEVRNLSSNVERMVSVFRSKREANSLPPAHTSFAASASRFWSNSSIPNWRELPLTREEAEEAYGGEEIAEGAIDLEEIEEEEEEEIGVREMK